MKRTKQALLLLNVLLLCGFCLPFPPANAEAAHYVTAAVRGEADGILTLENGETWYKVRQFEDDADYLLTVQNDAGEPLLLAVTNGDSTQYIWNYYRFAMTPSDAPRTASLNAGSYTLAADHGSLVTNYTGGIDTEHLWMHDDTALCFCENGVLSYLKYDAAAEAPFSMTDDRSEASAVTLYSRAETLERCIVRQPAAESYVTEGSGYPAPVFSVGLADVTADSIRWFVDGEEQLCVEPELTADSLTDQPAGIHRVSCLVEAHDSEGVHYRERSADAAFVIAKGVVPDSILTFSDVHEEYGLITDAIAAVMKRTGGYIPSLVICTGDLVNGPTAETERELNRYYPQITAHLGGLDTVFVAGNHDSAEAASIMSAAAQLGADPALPAAGGLIFDGDSEAVLKNGTNSRYAKGIITYGINYGAEIRETPAGIRYTYEDIIPEVEHFLEETAAQYHGELVVISAHSGLHVIGMQPESVSTAQIQLSPWMGENMYNVDCSFELAETINRYAEQYDMDILYLFGHDHSRSETEMFLTEGSRIVSARHYADRSTDSLTLHFTYAHAGYLSSVIGCANRNFTFIYRDGSRFSYNLMQSEGSLIRQKEFRAKQIYEAPAAAEPAAVTAVPETTETAAKTETTASQTAAQTETTASQTAAQKTASAAGSTASAPETAGVDAGEKQALWLVYIPACLIMLMCRIRRKNAS